MDGWQNVNNHERSPTSAHPKGPRLPAPGTVVMANVEEDLGDGVYSLRWGSNRIAVNSRSPLTPGQSLILRSESSPEGKTTLVVQGTALPEGRPVPGKVIYGPARHAGGTPGTADALSHSRTYSPSQSQGGMGLGNQVAAGVSRAVAVQAPPTMQSFVGLVLEPLPDLQLSVRMLSEVVDEERTRAGETTEKEKQEGQDKTDGDDGAAAEPDSATVATGGRRPPARPLAASPPASAGQTGQPGAVDAASGQSPAASGQHASDVSVSADPAREARPSPPGQPATPAPPSPAAVSGTPIAPGLTGVVLVPAPDGPATGGTPRAPIVPPETSAPGASVAEAGASPLPSAVPASPTPLASSPSGQPAVQPAAVLPRGSGPVIPAVPESVIPDASAPSAPSSPDQPATRPAAVLPQGSGPAIPEIVIPGASAPSASSPPGQPAVQPAIVLPQGSGSAPSVVPELVVPGLSAPSTPPPAGPPANQPGGVPSQGNGPVIPGVPEFAVSDAPASSAFPPPGQPVSQPAIVLPRGSDPAIPITPEPAVPDVAPAVSSPSPMTPPEQGGHPPPSGTNAAPPDTSAQPSLPSVPGTPPPADGTGTAAPGTGEPPPPVSGAPSSGGSPPPRGAPDSTPLPAAQTPAPSPAPAADAAVREALDQMVHASELPLAEPARNAAPAAGSGRMPDAIVDKAAGIFLRAAGLTPDPATLEAARALVRNNVQVDRETVQALMTVAAMVPEDGREAALKAAARLSAKDIPVSPPLVSGLADVLSRRGGPADLLRQAVASLPFDAVPPDAQTLLRGAADILAFLHVDLGGSDVALALERYISTFGREALGKAIALIEVSAQSVLENNSLLQDIDRALGAILPLLEENMGKEGARPAEPPRPAAPAPERPGQAPPPAAPESPHQPLPASPVGAYLNAPRALPIADMLRNLPPMPKIVGINDPVPQETPAPPSPSTPPGQEPRAGDAAAKAEPPAVSAPRPDPGQAVRPGETPAAKQAATSALLAKLDVLFQTPGLNRAEFDLLRPSGFLDRFLNAPAQGPDAARVKAEAEALFRKLTSQNRDGVEKALRDLQRRDPEVLRETAARLSRSEQDVLRADQALSRLADAAGNLRDLGRQLMAVKAENIAGQDRNPGVMLAEVPFKLNDDAGDGRMQMFYRRGKGKGEGWTSRVILDLNTTRMGPVLGDLRFFAQDMAVNVFVERQELADYLAAGAEPLIAALSAKGFRVKTKFMVLPPPAAAPRIHAERPDIEGERSEEPAARSATGVRRLDIKG